MFLFLENIRKEEVHILFCVQIIAYNLAVDKF